MYTRLFILIVLFIGTISSQQIHPNLIQCYRGNETRPFIAYTPQLLVELVRKIEDANPTSLDIRQLSVQILHRLRIDGIERAPSIGETEFVTPYRSNGIMAPKYRLVMQLVSDTPSIVNIADALTPFELCQLHRMLSSSVEPYERGDETRTCPLTMMSVERTPTPWIKWNKFQDPFSGTATVSTERVSRCPMEMGVIRSNDYGSFSPGTIVASIAAGLQPQNVRINEFVEIAYKKTKFENLESMQRRDAEKSVNRLLRSLDSIDNTYAAGLAGDLAEVCVYQGPYSGINSTVGLPGTWNNTILPRTRFLSERHGARWELTDAEILAGIDGLYLSQQVSSWVQRVRRIRLSQIIDMYYSARGIPGMAIESVGRTDHRSHSLQKQPPTSSSGRRDTEVIQETAAESDMHSFRRKSPAIAVFENAELELEMVRGGGGGGGAKHLERFSVNDGINSACDRAHILNLIDREKLRDETYFLAQVLQFSTSSMAVADETLRLNCDAAVNRFFNYTADLLKTLPTCNEIMMDYRKPIVDLTMVIDGSRGVYENQEFISYLAESVEVSRGGSYISVIHGTSTQTMVNRTNSVAVAFEQLRNFTDPYPTGLSLSRSLQRAIHQLSARTLMEKSSGVIADSSRVILIASQGQRVDQLDFDSASRMIHGSLQQFPDLYFVFLTNSPDTFTELVRGAQTPFEAAHRQEHYKIIGANNVAPVTFGTELVRHLKTIPKRIMAPFCDVGSFHWRRTEQETSMSYYYEDYVSPNMELRYRISPAYLRKSEHVQVVFQVNYGELTVCMSREISYSPIQCFTIDESKTANFHVGDPCPNPLQCAGIYFSVTMDRSDMRCLENECRYPDQVRLVLRHSGLRCEHEDRGSSATKISTATYLLVLLILAIIVF